MAGYSGYSKSNNAIAAENDGRFNATQLAKRLKVSSAAIKALLTPSEWHHTSSYYNRTDYYNEPILLSIVDNPDLSDEELVELLSEYHNGINYGPDIHDIVMGRKTLQDLRNYKKGKTEEKVIADVEWLEWSGTRQRPKATQRKAENVPVTIKGAFAIIHTFSGDIKKKMDARGFRISIKRKLNETRKLTRILL